MNKPWKKPELVIMTRRMPEESVLSFCKNIVPYNVGPDVAAGSCALVGCGGDCSIQAGS